MPSAHSSTFPDDAAIRSWLSVVRAYHLCSELFGTRLAEVGVKTSEHEILINLQRQPGINQQALAARCFTAKSHVSALLNDMAAKGWIGRHADMSDGRVKRLTLTAAGSEMAARTAHIQAEVVTLMAKDLAHSELLLIARSMTNVCVRLEAALGVPKEKH